MNLEPDVKLAQQGDREAFVRLIRQLENDLYGMAFSILRKEETVRMYCRRRFSKRIPR